MPQELEKPRMPNDLYLARGDDVCDARPVLTGDVLDDVEVTEPDGSRVQRSVMVVEHPCSLRSDGVNLASKLLVAAVHSRGKGGSWRGNFSLMFLPELRPQEYAAADFGDPYIVGPGQFAMGHRVACLSTFGINGAWSAATGESSRWRPRRNASRGFARKSTGSGARSYSVTPSSAAPYVGICART